MAGIAMKLAKDREAAEGLGSHERAVKYLNQDYQALRDECLEAGTLFQDPAFPAQPSSLGFKELGPYSSKTRGIEWKRPTVGSARGTGGVGVARKGAGAPGGASVGGCEPQLPRSAALPGAPRSLPRGRSMQAAAHPVALPPLRPERFAGQDPKSH